MFNRNSVKTWHIGMLLLVLAFVSYGAILDNYFFLDDTCGVYAGYVLSQDPSLIFSENFDVMYMSHLWRVIVALSYIPNFLLSGLEPWSYYLVNILLHAGCGLLSYLIVRKLTNDKNVAVLATVLGAMSMIKADAVMMIAHRTTLLGAFFSLASYYLFTCLLIRGWLWRDVILCVTFYLLGIFSYETTLVLPFVFFGTCFIVNGKAWYTDRRTFLMAMFLSIFSLLLMFGLDLVGSSDSYAHQSLLERGWHVVRNLLAVVPIFFVPPFLLHYDSVSYHNVPMTYGWREMLGTIIIVVLLWLGIRLKNRPILIGILFFVIMSAPITQVQWLYYPDFATGNSPMMLRWSIGKFSYLSSFGIYLVVGTLLFLLFRYVQEHLGVVISSWTAVSLIACFLAFNGYWLFQREQTWADRRMTEYAREEVKALEILNLGIPDDCSVYLHHFGFWGRHATNFLRVLYQNPDLEVLDARDWRPGGPEKNLFIINKGPNGFPDYEVFTLDKFAPRPSLPQ